MRLKFWQPKTSDIKTSGTTVAAPPPPVQSRTVDAPRAPIVPVSLNDLDLRVIWSALMRKKLWVIIPTLAVALLSFVAVNSMSPRYKSEARILVDGRENVFLRPNAERVEDRVTIDPEAITSQVQVVLSRDLAREIIRKNRLGERPEFDSVLRGISPLRSLLAMLGIGRDPLKLTAEERILESYYDRLTAFAIDKSRVIAIEFQSSDPELAARVANSIAEGYMSMQQVAKQDQAKSASQWLSGEIDNLRKKVAEAESRVEDFRGKTNLFIGMNNTTLSNQQMGEINTQASNARALRSDAESKARLIREMLRTGQPIEASEVLNSELVRRLGEQRVTLRAQLAEQSSTLLDGHPRIKELRAQIGDLDRQLRDEAAKISRSLENDAKIAGARAESMNASLDQLKKQASASNGQDVQLRALEREAKAQRDLLESYLAKFREATARESIDVAPTDGRIISRAIVSNTPAFPKKLPIVLIATLTTFMLSAGWIVTAELLRMTAPRASAPVAPAFAAPQMRESVVQNVSSEDLDRAVHDLLALGTSARKITVMGLSKSATTSVTALTLARAMAQRAGVVLVDISGGSSTLRAASIDPAAPGVSDLVQGSASFGQIICRDRSSGLQIVNSGSGLVDASMLQSPRLSMTIDALMRVYDHVILDAGSLDDAPEQLVSNGAQAVLVSTAALDEPTQAAIERELLSVGFAGARTIDSASAMSHIGRAGERVAAA